MSWAVRCALGVIALGVLAAIWGFGIEPGLLTTREVAMESEKWPADRPPLRISVISDLHVGAPHVDLSKVDVVVSRSNAFDPDLVVLLGDYVIHEVVGGSFVAPEETAARLKRLKGRYGVIAVLGNHDWWFDGARVRQALEAGGFVVLDNEAHAVETPNGPVWLAGLADDMTQTPDMPATMAQIDSDDPVVVLSHDPVVFRDVPERPVVTLAGHTHGGQIYLPWIGALVIPGRSPLKWAYGRIRENGRDMYVTAGIGTSILPVRFNMPPEIAFVTISSVAAPERH